MEKFYGVIGYAVSVEKPENSGIWVDDIVERKLYGNIVKNNRRLNSSENVNDNITFGNQVSVVADPYAWENFYAMRYIVLHGCKWKITSIDVERPRLLLTLGGLYNG